MAPISGEFVSHPPAPEVAAFPLELLCCSVITFSCDYQPSLVLVPQHSQCVGIFACRITLLGLARVHCKLFFVIRIKL